LASLAYVALAPPSAAFAFELCLRVELGLS
jgi:hypothetical protein